MIMMVVIITTLLMTVIIVRGIIVMKTCYATKNNSDNNNKNEAVNENHNYGDNELFVSCYAFHYTKCSIFFIFPYLLTFCILNFLPPLFLLLFYLFFFIYFFLIRPKGGYEEKFSLAPIAPRLSELLGVTVPLVADCVGAVVADAVSKVERE